MVSNRDEKHSRGPAMEPTWYNFPNGKILFPKDPDKGGTWIAIHENGNAAVLLNGGVKAHIPEPFYRRSRGLILLDLLSANSPHLEFQLLAMEGIEPFTAVIWDRSQLFECIWDGKEKHMTEKNAGGPHIWSSVTLYGETVSEKRKQWFFEWLAQSADPALDEILHFHQTTGDGDQHNDLKMNRDGYLYTVSVTGMYIGKSKAEMVYLDLRNNTRSVSEIDLLQTTLPVRP